MLPLLDQPHRDALRRVRSGATVYLSVNPVEFHGPHLSLHNDRLVSEGLIRDLHARLEPEQPLLVGADLEVGVDPCPGPGSRHTPFTVVRRLVLDACRGVAELGAKRVVLMTFHGAPLHALAIEAGVRWLSAQGIAALAPFNAVVRELVDADPTVQAPILAPVADPADRAALAADFNLDFHAGFWETSATLHHAPDSVSPDFVKLPPCPTLPRAPGWNAVSRLAAKLGARTLAAEAGFVAAAAGWYSLRPFPGYTGRPHLANPESGAAFTRLVIERYAKLATEVFAGRARSPAPIMPWVERLSLGGRLGKLDIPASEVARLAAG
jgi:creatinine amidohydrolase